MAASTSTAMSRSHAMPLVAVAATWAATFLAFSGALDGTFVAYDDPLYVVDNEMVRRGLTLESMRWAFLDTTAASNWHPLTWLSHMLDVELFGLQAGGHHLTSVVLHASVAALLAWLACRVSRSVVWGALGSLVFALHPLRVESVAWISERKDVLSGLFLTLTLVAWRSSVVSGDRATRRWWYAASLVSAAAGLMAKPMLVTLPLLLLIFDLWPLRRKPSLRLVVDKLPFVAMSAAISALTLLAQQSAMSSTTALPVAARAGNAVVSMARYVGKSLWPTSLAAHYRYPLDGWSPAAVAGALAVLVLITGSCFLWWRARRPDDDAGAPVAVWAWFCIGLVPVLGLVHVGHASMADRYTYVPHMLCVLGISVLGARRSGSGGERPLPALTACAATVLLAAGTVSQVGSWRDTRAVFERAVAVDPHNGIAWFALAKAHMLAGDPRRAEEAAQRTVQIDEDEARLDVDRVRPDVAAHRVLWGEILAARGDHAGAIDQYIEALSLDAQAPAAHALLALSLLASGDVTHARLEARLAMASAALPPTLRERLTAAFRGHEQAE